MITDQIEEKTQQNEDAAMQGGIMMAANPNMP